MRTSEHDYTEMSGPQLVAIFVLMFLMGVAAGYLLFRC